MQTTPDAIIDFWLNETGPAGWYNGGEALDDDIRRRFMPGWRTARLGGLDGWMSDPAGSLALMILLDQFPRNMFRGDERSFSADAKTRRLAKLAIARGHDMATDEGARLFYYLPLMHSECLGDQDRSVRLIASRLAGHPGNLQHARAHREVIRRFGRFPFRNDALGRATTEAERQWIAAGGYGAVVEELAA